MFFKWEDYYELGIECIDEQHMQFVNKLNDLYFSLKQKRPQSEIDMILEGFKTYVNYHFDFEDKLLDKYEYPFLKDHLELHNEYNLVLSEMTADKTKFLGNLKTFNYLRDWFVHHICKEDTKYAEFLKEIPDFYCDENI